MYLIFERQALNMGEHGLAIDTRHIKMLGDCMTYRGAVLGINRYGIARMRASTMMLASFERTTEHIFDATWPFCKWGNLSLLSGLCTYSKTSI